jgi:hypothetical protein
MFYPGGKADKDDVEYYNYVNQGLVGENCWLGSPTIISLIPLTPLVEGRKDVCRVCPVGEKIRAHCLGRPPSKATEKKNLDSHPKFAEAIQDTSEALKARRSQQALAILRGIKKG